MTVWLVPIPLRTKHRWLSWVLLPCFFAKSCTAPSASLLNHLATVCACRTTSLVLERRGSKLGMISPSNLREIAKQLMDSVLQSLTCGNCVSKLIWNQRQTKNKPSYSSAQNSSSADRRIPREASCSTLKCDFFENLWNTFRISFCPKPTALALYKVFSSSCRKSDMEVSPPWQTVFLTRRRWQTEWPNLLTRQHLRFVRVSFPALHPRAKHPSFSSLQLTIRKGQTKSYYSGQLVNQPQWDSVNPLPRGPVWTLLLYGSLAQNGQAETDRKILRLPSDAVSTPGQNPCLPGQCQVDCPAKECLQWSRNVSTFHMCTLRVSNLLLHR